MAPSTSTWLALEADLLVRLAQRGGRGVGVVGLRAAAGEADLARWLVRWSVRCVSSTVTGVALDQRHQHRRMHRFAVDEAALRLDLRRPDRRRDEALAQRRDRQPRSLDRRQVVVDPEDRQFLRD